jgi:sarcosine oxidase, subunit beta
MPSTTSDVIVIGSGVIGASVAHELARDGLSVAVVDRAAGPGQGSTSASSAVIRFNYSTWTGVIAAWEAKHVWEEWAAHLDAASHEPLARFHRTGGLSFDSPNQDRRKVLALFDRADVPYEEWDAETIRKNLPHLDLGRHYPPKRVTDDAFWETPTGQLTGYWTPDSGFVDDPALAAHNLMMAARRRGAVFHFGLGVTSVIRDHDRVGGVELADGSRHEAAVVVNVAGPHSWKINEMAGVGADFSVRTRPMRQEVHEVPPPEDANTPLPLVSDLDLGTYSRGTPSGQLIVGGTEPECDTLQWLENPDDYARTVSSEVYEAQVYRAARRMPTLRVPNTPRGVVGVYDVSDDWVPIYDRTDLPGFYVAIGTSGNQFKNAPMIGRLMRAVIDGERSVVGERTGLEIGLASFGRLRPRNPDSTGTVMG